MSTVLTRTPLIGIFSSSACALVEPFAQLLDALGRWRWRGGLNGLRGGAGRVDGFGPLYRAGRPS